MKKVGHMKSGISLIVLGLVLIALLPAVPTALDQGRAAETSENYQSAVSLYRKAMADSPRDPVPARALAELFSGKNLYNLALPVWQEVIRRAPGDPSAWISLAQTWSYLDQNQRSVQVLTEASTRFPHHPDLVQSLAWMLFKTEEFHRGITLVESYISQYGSDRSLEMTLGTLYSSLLNYDVSRSHYLKSLTLASGSSADTRNFRSIAWYNLSLLEKDFYHFDLAEQDIRRSIAEEDRPAGAVALGELAEGRRNFFEARRLFQKAMKSDDTPLARFDLARLYLQFGFLQQAEEQLIQVEHHKDDSWIFNYGVTKDKLRRDLAELSGNVDVGEAEDDRAVRVLDLAGGLAEFDLCISCLALLSEATFYAHGPLSLGCRAPHACCRAQLFASGCNRSQPVSVLECVRETRYRYPVSFAEIGCKH